LGILFSTDIRLCKEDCYFQFTEVKRGLVPAIISAYIVPQIGVFKAKDLMITGRKLGSIEAFQWGFLTGIAKVKKLYFL
jgi:methylglutaconyl-CoA hydratase